ncbi:MAG: helix-turn-helix domain-containing protein [Clostridia bacterium]|nr:helix-turn-helix domain-containing protein [Clostridia bacterium]
MMNRKETFLKGVNAMTLADINPYVRYAAVHYIFQKRSHDSFCYDCRLFFIREGEGILVADGNRYLFRNNSVIFLPPGTRYHFFPGKDEENIVWVVLNLDLTQEHSRFSNSFGTASETNFVPEKVLHCDLPEPFHKVWVHTADDTVRERLAQCAEEFLDSRDLYREVCSALVKGCLTELVRASRSAEQDRNIAPILEYIRKNAHDPALTNERIAEAFSYHPHYLSSLIRKHTGKSLHQYLIQCRIRIAKRLLVTTGDSVSDIAWKSGFPSVSYFIKIFRRETGFTPKHYRDSTLDKQL